MEEEWKSFFRQGFPLEQRVNYGPRSFKTQLTLIEQLGGQCEQGFMGTVVVGQLSYL